MAAEIALDADIAGGRVAWILGPYRVLRGNRDLEILFACQTVSCIGDWLSVVALIVVVYNITQSAALVGVLTFVRLLPYALFLPVTGTLADRWPRKGLLVAAELGRAACILGLTAVGSRSTLPLAFVLVFLATLMASFHVPAFSSVVASVVPPEDLVAANSVLSQADSLSLVLGPSLGAILLLLGQPRTAFAVTSATALLSAVGTMLVHVPARTGGGHPEEGGWIAATRAGLRYLLFENQRVLSGFTLSVAGIMLLNGAFWTLSVVLPRDVWHFGQETTGWLNAVYGLGGLAGSMLIAPLVERISPGRFFVLAAATSPLLAGLFGLSPRGASPFVLLVLLGVSDVIVVVVGYSVIENSTPSALLGRVFGAFEAAITAAMVVGALLVGPVVALFQVRGATVALACLSLLTLLASLPHLRRMEGVLGVRMFLHRVPILRHLSLQTLDDVASRLQLVTFPAGAEVVRQGEIGDCLYLVESGALEVLMRGDGPEPVRIDSLSVHDYFGETALLEDIPRTA
ncbi:MAG: MFS transporter, partial [Chloroflexi bacterium]|nr:MFS transporter [Chloroflexota bacterium]